MVRMKFGRALRVAVVGLPLLVLGVAVGAPTGKLARAGAATCDTSWKNTAGGAWETPSNWTAGVPTTNSNVCITKVGTYTVTVSTQQPDTMESGRFLDSLTIGGATGTQTLEMQSTCASPALVSIKSASTINPNGVLDMTDTAPSCVTPPTTYLYIGAGTLTNKGTINVLPGTGDTARDVNGDVVNKGRMVVSDLTTLTWTGSLTNASGTIEANGSGSVTIGTGTYFQGNGTTSGTSADPVKVTHDLVYTGSGVSTVEDLGTVSVGTNIPREATIDVPSGCDRTVYLDMNHPLPPGLTNAGTIKLIDVPCAHPVSDPGSAYLVTNGMTNTGTILTVPGVAGNPWWIDGNLTNSGTIELGPQTTLTLSYGTVTETSAGTITTDGSPTPFGQITADQTFGTLGNITLGGTLDIASADTPTLGATFPVISCASCETGKFKTIAGQPPTGGLAYGVASTTSGTTLTVKKAANLSLTGTAPVTVSHGMTFAYTFQVQNAGPNTATSTKLTDTLPTGVTYVSSSSGCTISGTTVTKVTCTLGNLTTGTTVPPVTITVTAGPAGSVANTATVAGSTVDITPADATAHVTVQIT